MKATDGATIDAIEAYERARSGADREALRLAYGALVRVMGKRRAVGHMGLCYALDVVGDLHRTKAPWSLPGAMGDWSDRLQRARNRPPQGKRPSRAKPVHFRDEEAECKPN